MVAVIRALIMVASVIKPVELSHSGILCVALALLASRMLQEEIPLQVHCVVIHHCRLKFGCERLPLRVDICWCPDSLLTFGNLRYFELHACDDISLCLLQR